MGKFIGRRLAAERADRGVMADFAEADEARKLLKSSNLRLQKGRALGDLRGFRLVGWWRALDSIGDHYALERQAIVGVGGISAGGQIKARKSLVE